MNVYCWFGGGNDRVKESETGNLKEKFVTSAGVLRHKL